MSVYFKSIGETEQEKHLQQVITKYFPTQVGEDVDMTEEREQESVVLQGSTPSDQILKANTEFMHVRDPSI